MKWEKVYQCFSYELLRPAGSYKLTSSLIIWVMCQICQVLVRVTSYFALRAVTSYTNLITVD